MQTEKNAGFTLIELIVVMAIMGILMAVAIPKYVDLTQSAKKAHDQETLAALRTATVLLYGSNIMSSVTNSAGTYWPTYAQITNQMQDSSSATNWLFVPTTMVSYNMTNGAWVATNAAGVKL